MELGSRSSKSRMAQSLENPTLDKIRRVMNLVYKHGQGYGPIPRDASANPMNWVRHKTTSGYTAVVMNPQQAFEILNIPEPRRTLVLADAATALRASEILGLIWIDLEFADQVIEVRLRLGSVQSAQVKGLQSPEAREDIIAILHMRSSLPPPHQKTRERACCGTE
jgi:integrase